jgi:protein-L-isoaspartate(D-aspartate) O-methyltransferase
MKYIDFLSPLHKSTKRDYLARVNDLEYPKHIAAELAKKWDFDYWDGDRRINYGGYKYIPGRWKPVAELLIEHYNLTNDSKILDVGCGKAFLLFEIKQILPGITVRGLDISEYAKNNSINEMMELIDIGCCSALPYQDKEFDLAFSLNTFHNLNNEKLEQALKELIRVSMNSYICVESYRNELEKTNLLYWQVTCEQFNTPDDWKWWFLKTGYNNDFSFIYFE